MITNIKFITSVFCSVLLTGSCGFNNSNSEIKKTISIDDTQRKQLIKNMNIWSPINTGELDLFAGPDHADKFSYGETVYCTFKEPEEGDFGAGLNPKFRCKDKQTGKMLKVKYNIRNAEVYGEIAFSRLMYALGFNYDDYYTVRVVCENCPKDPWEYIQSGGNPHNINSARYSREDLEDYDYERGTHVFLPALIEVKKSGDRIENFEDQGISWQEFNDFSELTRSQKIIRDAFVLLMGFVHHADSKPDQQRLSCVKGKRYKTEGGHGCPEADFLVHDGGWSFGAGVEPSINSMRAKMHLKFWTRYPVFKNKKTCKIGVRKLMNSEFVNKEISEEGRQFLANLLNKLSRDQIKDIFRASRVDFRDYVLHGTPSEVTLNNWADAFEQRRSEISEATCPNSID